MAHKTAYHAFKKKEKKTQTHTNKNTKSSKQSQKLFRLNTEKGKIEFINVQSTSIGLRCSELLKLKGTYIKYY